MKTQTRIEKLKLEIEEKQKELKELESQNEWVKIGDYEIEKNLHLEMDTISKIKIPEGCELLTLQDFLDIYNNHRDKFNFGGLPDEVVKQPIKENEKTYPFWNVWFHRLGDDGLFGLVGDDRCLRYDSRVRGVRFKRRVK